jgi:hypothetical protein
MRSSRPTMPNRFFHIQSEDQTGDQTIGVAMR